MQMINKIALGTVQFGMDYGINNKRGQVPKEEVFTILNQAIDKGIDTVDTARNYGESEKIIGVFSRNYHRQLRIISKLPKCAHQEVAQIFRLCLQELGVSGIYGYLIHNFPTYKEDPRVWDELIKLKASGRIEKIGFSLYFPAELETIFTDGLKIDMVQFPFSIFDQRFKSYLRELKKRKIEIYVRSVFLQGLVFKQPSELSDYFMPIRDRIEKLNLLAKQYNLSVIALCLNFALFNEFIDKVVVGIDSVEHFRDLIGSLMPDAEYRHILPALSNLDTDNEHMVVPFYWPKEAAHN